MAFINAFCNKGDEVVCFEPMFPNYLDHAEFAGGRVLGLPLSLEEGEWKYDSAALLAALKKPTSKVFLFNNPHNPTGKVFTRAELEEISAILDQCPHVMVLSDEVYDFLTFDGLSHISFASVGDNWNRTVTVYSGGKLLNATGWKIGWTVGPQRLMHWGGVVSNTVYYCNNTPGQMAIAKALDKIEQPGYNGTDLSFKQTTQALFQANRDLIINSVNEMKLPWKAVPLQGGYFVIADIRPCADLIPEIYKTTHDYEPEVEGQVPIGKNQLFMPDGRIPLDLAFCRWMAVEKGVVMMPSSFFCAADSPTITDYYARLAICMDPQSTEAALARLRVALD